MAESHPLETPWTFRAHGPADATRYNECHTHLLTVTTVEEWGAAFRHVPGGEVFAANAVTMAGKPVTGVSLFREGVRPEWEDPANAGGTTLALRSMLSPAQAGDAWATLCAGAAGETLGEDVLGVVVAQKRNSRQACLLKFEVWLRRGSDAARITRLLGHAGIKMTAMSRDAAPSYQRA